MSGTRTQPTLVTRDGTGFNRFDQLANALSWLVAGVLLATGIAGCASPPVNVARTVSHALADPLQTNLGQAFAKQSEVHPGQSGFHIVATGFEALHSRIALADAAEHTLDLQYFTVGDDHTTDVLLQRLIAAGQRGVRVRILLDDIYSSNREFARRASVLVPNLEVRLFNPFRTGGVSGLGRLFELAGDAKRLNRRMHNKLWVADNVLGIVGGRNLSAEYFDANSEANFSDLDVLAVGPVVRMLSRCFDEYWNSSPAVPIAGLLKTKLSREQASRVRPEFNARRSDPVATRDERMPRQAELAGTLKNGNLPLTWARATAGCDRPDKPETGSGTTGIEHHWPDSTADASSTKFELIVVSPYFIPTAHDVQHLGSMRQRGVRVAVLTNSLASTDSPAAHGGYARYRADLLRRGIELFEMRPLPGALHPLKHRWRMVTPATLHAKMVIVDRAFAIIGSSNQDPRSRRLNTESWVAIDSPALVAEMIALFEEGTQSDHAYRVVLRDPNESGDALEWHTVDDGNAVRHASEPHVSWWLWVWSSLLSTVVPEDLL